MRVVVPLLPLTEPKSLSLELPPVCPGSLSVSNFDSLFLFHFSNLFFGPLCKETEVTRVRFAPQGTSAIPGIILCCHNLKKATTVI